MISWVNYDIIVAQGSRCRAAPTSLARNLKGTTARCGPRPRDDPGPGRSCLQWALAGPPPIVTVPAQGTDVTVTVTVMLRPAGQGPSPSLSATAGRSSQAGMRRMSKHPPVTTAASIWNLDTPISSIGRSISSVTFDIEDFDIECSSISIIFRVRYRRSHTIYIEGHERESRYRSVGNFDIDHKFFDIVL